MVVPHYTYLKLKMPGPRGVITINGNTEHSLRTEEHDTSPTYLLFQTLLPLFWTLTCMIWMKLTRTDDVFSRTAMVLFYVQKIKVLGMT